MILHLGVVDMPYTTGAETTAQVARYLENKYHVMEHFYELHTNGIAAALTESLMDAVENLQLRGEGSLNPFPDSGIDDVHDLFDKFLTDREMDHLGYPGIPTVASGGAPSKPGRGRSLRFKGKRSAGSRPSFIDTGLYQNSFRAWVTIDGDR